MHFSFWLMREFGNEKSLTHLLNTSYEQLQIDNFYPLIPSILCMSEYDNVMLLANHGCEHLLCMMFDTIEQIDRCEHFNNGEK